MPRTEVIHCVNTNICRYGEAKKKSCILLINLSHNNVDYFSTKLCMYVGKNEHFTLEINVIWLVLFDKTNVIKLI
jgi:hypothetical protein